MHTLIVYESMFGNTQRVAEAIAAGLRTDVEVVNVDAAPRDLSGVDLLVVGGPTHVHGMSRPSTRTSAAKQAKGEVRSHTGLREWLGSLGTVPAGIRAAAYDTRLKKPRWLTGSAANGVRKSLRRNRFDLPVAPESFFVSGENPARLLAGEAERAESWGQALSAFAGERR